PASALRLAPKEDISYAVVHPEGRWVATVVHDGSTTLWDATDGRLVRQLRDRDSFQPQFSPDVRWLAVTGYEGRLYAVGSWEAGLRFDGHGVFSPDSKSLAVADTAGVIRLLEPETGREFARLEDPNLEAYPWVGFSPDGTRLITTTSVKARGVHVWDLPALRARLKE